MDDIFILFEQKSMKIINNDDREEIQKKLLNISSEEALKLYEILCMASLCSYEDTNNIAKKYNIPFSKWTTENDMTRFVNSFINVGPLLDRIADCIEYTPTDREVLWKGYKERWKTMHDSQLINKQIQEKMSTFNVESRKLNEKAFKIVSNKLIKSKININLEWQQVINLKNVELNTKTPLFWSHVKVNQLNNLQLRALLYKLYIYQEEYNLPQYGLDLKNKIYYKIVNNEINNNIENTKKKKYIYICFCRSWKRIKITP